MIIIRPHEPADADTFYEHQADPVASEMAKFPSRDLESHRAHWERRVFGDPNTLEEVPPSVGPEDLLPLNPFSHSSILRQQEAMT